MAEQVVLETPKIPVPARSAKKECNVNMTLNSSATKFNSLSVNLTKLLHGRREGDRECLNALIDELNSLNFKLPIVTQPEKALLVINQFCLVVPPGDTFLVAKGCQLIATIVRKQHIKVEGNTLSQALKWCIQALKACADIAIVDILTALEALLRGNGTSVERPHELLGAAGVLTPFLTPAPAPAQSAAPSQLAAPLPELRVHALRCLEALASPPATLDPQLLGVLESTFKAELTRGQENAHPQVVEASLQGLRWVLAQNPERLRQQLGEVLGLAVAFMSFGLPGRPAAAVPQCLYPSPLPPGPHSAPQQGGGAQGSRPRNRHKGREDLPLSEEPLPVLPVTSSDSEGSDPDSDAVTAGSRHRAAARVRHAAVLLLLACERCVPWRVLLGYWPWLLGADAATQSGSGAGCSLPQCATQDPSARVRLEALGVLVALLGGAHAFLQQADDRQQRGSFTPFSEALGCAVRELHHALCRAAFFEPQPAVITQLLRCLARLVQASPYRRLAPGLLTRVVRAARPLATHRDPTVQVASFTVLRAVAAAEAPLPEALGLLQRFSRVRNPLSPGPDTAHGVEPADTGEEEEEEVEAEGEEELGRAEDQAAAGAGGASQAAARPGAPCWLLAACLQRVRPDSGATPVLRVECLQTLRALAEGYCEPLLAHQLPLLASALQQASDSADTSVRLHAGRLLQAVGSALAQAGPGRDRARLELWRTVLPGPVTRLAQCGSDPAQRAAACDCVAAVGVPVFDQLPREQQMLCVSLLLGACCDEEATVRASAVRALGVCTLHRSLREDPLFLADACERVQAALRDQSLPVRVKASWALAELCDALLLNREDASIAPIPDSLLLDLLSAALAATKDSEKLRCNVLRALGNSLRLLGELQLKEASAWRTVESAVHVLLQAAEASGLMKARWNACYSLRGALANPALHRGPAAWQAAVFTSLSWLVQHCSNFKVRAAAAAALAAPLRREHYGAQLPPVWCALAGGLERAAAPEVQPSELAHRDALLSQLTLSLAHCTALMEPSDLPKLQDAVGACLESLQPVLLRCQAQLTPERAQPLAAADAHLMVLQQAVGLTAEQRQAAEMLARLFAASDGLGATLLA